MVNGEYAFFFILTTHGMGNLFMRPLVVKRRFQTDTFLNPCPGQTQQVLTTEEDFF